VALGKKESVFAVHCFCNDFQVAKAPHLKRAFFPGAKPCGGEDLQLATSLNQELPLERYAIRRINACQFSVKSRLFLFYNKLVFSKITL
jgi:hypothetical protein